MSEVKIKGMTFHTLENLYIYLYIYRYIYVILSHLNGDCDSEGEIFIQFALTFVLSPAGQASLVLLLPEGVCLIIIEQFTGQAEHPQALRYPGCCWDNNKETRRKRRQFSQLLSS